MVSRPFSPFSPISNADDVRWVHWLCPAPSIDEQPELEELHSRDVYNDGVLRCWFYVNEYGEVYCCLSALSAFAVGNVEPPGVLGVIIGCLATDACGTA